MAREGSKKAEVVDLMRRPEGATLAEIMKPTGWQPHTVRGFVCGTLIKKLRAEASSRSAATKRSVLQDQVVVGSFFSFFAPLRFPSAAFLVCHRRNSGDSYRQLPLAQP